MPAPVGEDEESPISPPDTTSYTPRPGVNLHDEIPRLGHLNVHHSPYANGAKTTVSKEQAQSVANSITIGASFQAAIENFRQASDKIDILYTETATFTCTVTMTAQ